MSLQRDIETSAAAFIYGRTGLSVRKTEDADQSHEPRMILALCPDSRGEPALPGCETCKLTIEQRTVIRLYPVRGLAVAAHFEQWDLIKESVMQSDLADQLLGTAPTWGINGIEDVFDFRQDNQNGVLINSVTITIHAVSKALSA